MNFVQLWSLCACLNWMRVAVEQDKYLSRVGELFWVSVAPEINFCNDH